MITPTANQLIIAPEIGVLAILDTVLATAAYQLVTENPELSADSLARGQSLPRIALLASRLTTKIHNLRDLIDAYRVLAISTNNTLDSEFPF